MTRIRILIGTLALLLGVPGVLQAQSRSSFERAATRGSTKDDRAAAERRMADFWSSLGDTTLARVVGEALRANHDVRAARARVSGAQASRTGAYLAMTPGITATTAYSRQRFASYAFPGSGGTRFPDQDVWDAGLRLDWELDVFGRLRNSARGQSALVSSAYEDLTDTQLQLATQIADAYYELRGAQNRLAVARRNAENQRGTLEITRNRLEAGRGTALDMERAQAQLSATLAFIPALEAQLASLQHRLTVLTGRAPGASSLQFDTTFALALPESLVIARADSVARTRPDIRAAEQLVDASSAFTRSARANYLPRLSIAGGAGYTSNSFDALGNTGTPRYTVGPVLSWAAFDLGRVKASVDAARAAEVEAKARYQQAVLRSIEEVETTTIAYKKARESLAHLEAAAAASERAAELARLRYTEGASDFLQVLDAERTLLEAQDRLAQGKIEASRALVAAYRASGGGSSAR